MFVSESVKNYKSGILDPTDCNITPTNHAIVLMGYGTGLIFFSFQVVFYNSCLGVSTSSLSSTDEGLPYWIVKNSWGFDWGEGGYLRLIRGKSACGIGSEYVATVILGDNIIEPVSAMASHTISSFKLILYLTISIWLIYFDCCK